jgi:RNA polymerase sigma factor (sigma-70 family)
MPTTIETHFFELLKAGDQKGYIYVYNTYRKLLLSVAIVMLRDPHEAEDVVQEIFLSCWEKKSLTNAELDSDKKLKMYLCKATRNRCLNRLDANDKRRRDFEELLVSETTAPSLAFHVNEDERLAQELENGIRQLSTGQRNALVHRYYLNQSRPQIATELNIAENTVKVHLGRALQNMRFILKKSSSV